MKLYLLVRPTFSVQDFQAFVAQESSDWRRSPGATVAEEIVEAAGRICYMSFGTRQSPRTNREYLENLVRLGHESVLEHASWGFLLTGVSRAFTHQFVRHRVGFSFSQLSQQYHDESDAGMIAPRVLDQSPALAQAWNRAIEAAKSAYREILSELRSSGHPVSGLPTREWERLVRSAARSVLPNATDTKIFFSANARALRHFLEVRGPVLGDEEMRRVSEALLECLHVEAPGLFTDFRTETLADGSPVVLKNSLTSR